MVSPLTPNLQSYLLRFKYRSHESPVPVVLLRDDILTVIPVLPPCLEVKDLPFDSAPPDQGGRSQKDSGGPLVLGGR